MIREMMAREQAREQSRAAATAQVIRAFIAAYDGHDAIDRQIAARIRERLHGELYRCEREHYPESVDLGGEA